MISFKVLFSLFYFQVFYSLTSSSNCTYNFEFQNEEQEVSCHQYAETKSRGLRLHIQMLEEKLGLQPKSKPTNEKCTEKKEYRLNYTGDAQFLRL